jgi:hypothetical protein
VPVQSDSVPLINIYFTICMSFSLTAMIWFSIMNLLRETKRVPRFCRYLVLNYFSYFLFFNRNVFKKSKKKTPKESNSSRNLSKATSENSIDFKKFSLYTPVKMINTPIMTSNRSDANANIEMIKNNKQNKITNSKTSTDSPSLLFIKKNELVRYIKKSDQETTNHTESGNLEEFNSKLRDIFFLQ